MSSWNAGAALMVTSSLSSVRGNLETGERLAPALGVGCVGVCCVRKTRKRGASYDYVHAKQLIYVHLCLCVNVCMLVCVRVCVC